MSYIYLLSNASMPGLVKIGMTTKLPEERASQLSTTGVPGKFEVHDYWTVDPEELRSAELKIHKSLERYRYAKDREFFELSVEEAQSFIDKHFAKEGEQRKKRRKKAEQAAIEKDARQKAYSVKKEINETLSSGVDSLLENIGANRVVLTKFIENRMPAASIVSKYYKTMNSRDYGKPYLDPSWTCDWNGTRRSRKPRWQREFHLSFSLSASFKPFFGKYSSFSRWIDFEYVINTGELLVRTPAVANSSFIKNEPVPQNFQTLLKLAGLNDLEHQWFDVYGKTAELESSIKASMVCPSCKIGTLVTRNRKRNGKEFLGCDQFPKCRFTFDIV